MKNRLQGLAVSVIGLGLAGLTLRCEAALNSAQFEILDQQQGQGANITATAHVWIKGDKVRFEMKHPMLGEQLMISDGKDFYTLSPAQKVGQKHPIPGDKDKKRSVLEQITGDVNELRSKGKKVGRETVEGVPCDVYVRSVSKNGASESIKAWIGNVQNTPLPIKVIQKRSMSRPGAQVSSTHTITIRNLRTNVAVPDSQFVVPKDYKIATGQGGPAMPGVPHRGHP